MEEERKIILIGANGMLSRAIRKFAPIDYHLVLLDLPDFDLACHEQVVALRDTAAEVIINCAAYTDVDGCEENRDLARRVNGEGPGLLAGLAKEINATLIHVSTDFVFDGDKRQPYLESDLPHPLSVYGKSKQLGEDNILGSGLEKYFIIRTSWLYGAGGRNFVETMLRMGQEKDEIRVVADQIGTPTWTDDLARAIFSLLRTNVYGIYHFSGQGECSWYQFAVEIIDQARKLVGLRVENVLPISTEEYPLPAERPRYSVMSKQKIKQVTGSDIPAWQESLRAYLKQRAC